MLRGWSIIFVILAGVPFIVAGQTQSYTVPVAPRFTAIANHLNNGRNTLNEVLPNVPIGTRLYKWNPARQSYTQPATYTAAWSVSTPSVPVCIHTTNGTRPASVPTSWM